MEQRIFGTLCPPPAFFSRHLLMGRLPDMLECDLGFATAASFIFPGMERVLGRKRPFCADPEMLPAVETELMLSIEPMEALS